MQVSVRLAALPIPEYLDVHSGYSAPRSRIAGIYSRIYSYSRIFPNERALNLLWIFLGGGGREGYDMCIKVNIITHNIQITLC